MANSWTYEQKFNDLNTATLAGQDGWTLADGTANVVTTGTPYPDPTEVKHVDLNPTGGSQGDARKTITGVESGTVYISLKKATTTNYFGIGINPSSGGGINIYMIAGGQWEYNNGATWIDSGSYSANTYYRIGIAFECGAGGWEGLSADTYKWNIDNGSWNGPYGLMSAVASLDRIRIVGDGEGYFDYISPDYGGAVGPVNLKTYNTNVKANIKSIDTNLIANVKSLDTNA